MQDTEEGRPAMNVHHDEIPRIETPEDHALELRFRSSARLETVNGII